MRRTLVRCGGMLVLAMLVLGVGCATTEGGKEKKSKGKLSAVANPSKVKFGEFANVELKPFGIAEKHASNKGNQDSARVMDGMLAPALRNTFPQIKVLGKGEEFSKGGKTLQIAPFIKDIRKVSVGARVWAGVMAGSSHVLVQVTYRDSSTGEVIADPEFLQKAGAWTDAWGAEGNQMRDEICRDIAAYTAANK